MLGLRNNSQSDEILQAYKKLAYEVPCLDDNFFILIFILPNSGTLT